ncbi:MAG: hypothetical protein P1V20_06900 [Verrucomicrobiales bacterium]|nr:hypothetical protein [Verrucomicrobiales bacterium]
MKTKNIISKTTTALATIALAASFSALHAEDHDHDHGGAEAGPNGGRVLHKVEPHLEFFVTKDRKVMMTQLDDNLKAAAVGDQVVRVTAGDRSNPIRMTFVKQGNVLISQTAFPEGDDFPVVVQIKNNAGSKTIIEKFTLDMTQCPTCDHLEYACTCDHGHDH